MKSNTSCNICLHILHVSQHTNVVFAKITEDVPLLALIHRMSPLSAL